MGVADKDQAAITSECAVDCCGRDLAKRVLEQKIERKGKRVASLRVLLKVIPWELLSSEDEEALWNHFAFRD